MFKKHKFQQTEYPTKLEKNPFYIYFDESFKKILNKRKITKEFLDLLNATSKEVINEDIMILSLKRDGGILDVLYWLQRNNYLSIYSRKTGNIYDIVGDNIITEIISEYKKITNHIK